MNETEMIQVLREVAATIEADSVSANYAHRSSDALQDIGEWLAAFSVSGGQTQKPATTK